MINHCVECKAETKEFDLQPIESKNTDKPYADQLGAAHSKVAMPGWAGQDKAPTGRLAQDSTIPSSPQDIEAN